MLQNVDPALAEQIRAREAEVAESLSLLDDEVFAERARAMSPPSWRHRRTPRPRHQAVPGGVAEVACPDGGVVQVAGDIANQVERLLGDAAEAGYDMCGYGYRDPADQIAVRRSNCGTSNYAIYQVPASSCRPPTARPGSSMHEQGLAIDFTVGRRHDRVGRAPPTAGSRPTPPNYGMYNLPGEPWHWSVDGN